MAEIFCCPYRLPLHPTASSDVETFSFHIVPFYWLLTLDYRMTVLFRKSSPPSALCSISHAFSSNSRFDREVLDPLEVTFVPAEKQGPSLIMLRLQILFSQRDLSLMLSSPQCALRSFLKKQMVASVWIYIQVFYSIILIHVSAFVESHIWFPYYGSVE